MLRRGVVTATKDSTKLREIQASRLAGETLDQLEHFEAYGLTGRAKVGAEAIIAELGGDPSHAVVLVVSDRRFRPTQLADGDVAFYTDQDTPGAAHASAAHRVALQASGRKLVARCTEFDLKTAGGAQIIGGASSLTLKFESVEIVLSASGITLQGKTWLTHTHTGVTTGGGTSGPVS
jgi:phage baseplate assembly protein V